MLNHRKLFVLYFFLFIVLFNLNDYIERQNNSMYFMLNYNNNSVDIFNHLLFGFANSGNINLSNVLFQNSYIILIPLFAGQYISTDLCISGTYYFTRQNNRTKWYIKKAMLLLLFCLIAAAMAVALNIILIKYYDAHIDLLQIFLTTVSLTFCFYIIAMISNLLAIFFGIALSVISSVLIISLNCVIIQYPIRKISMICNSSILDSDTEFDLAVKLIINFVLAVAAFIVGYITVKKKEIGLINSEHLF